MKINELAKRLGVTPRAIRFYEEKGLLAPAKDRENGYRRFTDDDAWRLQTILALREAGVAVEDIRHVLRSADASDGEAVREYLEMQHSVLFREWLRGRDTLLLLEEMIGRLGREPVLPESWHALAERSREGREVREGWADLWNFDGLPEDGEAEPALQSARHVPSEPFYSQALDCAAAMLEPRPGELGLDAGAGAGGFALRLQEAGVSMTAVDQSRAMLRRCSTRAPGVRTRLGNLLALPFWDGMFDLAVSSFALHHLTEAQQPLGLAEMLRVVKPGGRIAVVDWMAVRREAAPRTACSGSRAALWAEHDPDPERLCRELESRGCRVTTAQAGPDGLTVLLAQRLL
ncbi:MerR family transcriptional regulator [Paenibacillus sp. KR2-11]|uniref:MerR family transcriptional regulator n=1 Tax=Paenibacillus sp. KR2-11 TaxID=3385500 RepID=UPI0038FBFC7C